MSSSSSPDFRTAQTSSPTYSGTSWETPPSPPQEFERPHTVINDIVTLRGMLDTVVRHINMPSKLYSKAHLQPRPTSELVQTPSSACGVQQSKPELYVDAEGISLSRSGELSILIVHVESSSFSHTYLIHVHVLGRPTFTTMTSNEIHSLKSIFEDNRIPKALFDCRMDSDALFGQFGVLLGGVVDLQLMCIASQGGGDHGLPGLEACLLRHLSIDSKEREWVSEAKARGQKLWRPRCGGSMERFNDNPLHPDIINYCVVDAAYLPRLFDSYNRALGNCVSLAALDVLWGNERLDPMTTRHLNPTFSWECRVLQHSMERVAYSLDQNFTGGTGLNPWYVVRFVCDGYDDDDDY